MPGRRPIARAGSLLAAAGLLAAAATVTIAVVPESRWGVAAIVATPSVAGAAAAAGLLAVVGATGHWGVVAPLAAVLAPWLAPRVGGPWILAGAGVLLAWVVAAGAGIRALVRIAPLVTRPRRHALAAAVAATMWLGSVAVAVAPFALTGDAPHYLIMARSLVADGDLDLRNDYDERTYSDFYPGSLEPRHTNPGPRGEEFPFHGLGVAVLVAPAFAAAGVGGAVATLVLVMAGAAALSWLAAWHLLRDAAAAWFGWTALVVAAPFGLHAAAIYPDGPAAAGVSAALWLAALLHRGAPVPLAVLTAGGCGLAALPWLHVRLALPAGVLGAAIVTAIWRGQPDRWARVAWFLMVPIVSLAGWLAAAQVMFGTWDPTAAMLQRTAPGGWSNMARGLLGLAVDHQFGLFPAAPVMAAAVAAAIGFARAFPLIGTATIVMGAGVAAIVSPWVWWGGDAAPARFLVVTLPAMALWLAWQWSSGGRARRRVLTITASLTAAITILYATVDGGAHAYSFADGRGSLFAALSRSVDVSEAMPSLFRSGETAATALALSMVWLAAAGAAVRVVTRLPARLSEGTATGLGGLVVFGGAVIAAQAGWQVTGARGWTPHTAALGLVADAVSGQAGLGLDSARLRPIDQLVPGLSLRTPESVPVQSPTLLYLPNLPAGDYAIHSAATASGGALRLEAGRDAWPLLSWKHDDTAPALRLDAAVHSVRVLADAPAGMAVWLQPLHVVAAPPRGVARRVTRIGDVIVYSMDDSSYPEPSGVWTGGDRSARLLLTTAGGYAPIDLQLAAGPAPVEVSVDVGARVEHVTLAAGAKARVELRAAGIHDVRIGVRGGFPAAALTHPSDGRSLGVRLAFSVAPADR